MKKIKILFFIYQMGSGGAARTILNIINNLDHSNYTAILVTLNFNGSYENELKNDVKFIKLNTERLRKSIFPLAKIIKREQIDIVFSTIPRINIIAILAAKLSRSKAKSIIREADNLGGSFKEDMQLLIFGFIYKYSDQIVSLSEGVAINLVKKYKVKREAIQVIYNPVDIEKIHERMAYGQLPTEHAILFQTEDKIVITAGRLVEQKDQKTLLEAFFKVKEEVNSRLIILGEGHLKDELQEQAKNLNIDDCVYFLGFQSNPYIYFKHSDLFVLSSNHEGFSHVVAEALATGTPVVSTDCKSGPAEVLKNGEFGELCQVGHVDEMAKKMKKVLKLSNNDRHELVSRGIKRAKVFNARIIVKEYEKLFDKTFKK